VFVRSLVGGAVAGAWRGRSLVVSTLLAAAACGGKVGGGLACDQLGWLLCSVTALCLAAPLVTVLLQRAPLAVVGALLFQVTMPVTLKGTHHLLPRHPGLAFGLPCLVIAGGALTLMTAGPAARGWQAGLGLMVLAVASVVLGLRTLRKLGLPAGPGAPAAKTALAEGVE
jgi:hypothetical protein